MSPDIDALLQRVPFFAGRRLRTSTLSGGHNNLSLRVDADGASWVARISDAARPGGGGYGVEREVQQRAARAGIAPEVVYADEHAGLLISEFLPGRPLDEADLTDRRTLAAISGLLRRLHALPLSGTTYDAIGAAASYADALDDHARGDPFVARCLAIIADSDESAVAACCHNDIVACNFVLGDSLKLIDFEYAADNDPYFDLASLIGWHGLGAAESDCLLAAYAGDLSPANRDRLARQCRRFDALQWLWLAARHPVPSSAERAEVVKQRLLAS